MNALIIKNFECPICNEIYQKPIYQCPVGHSLCGTCKAKLPLCSICKKPFQETRNFTLENIIEIIQVKCANELCPKTIALNLYTQHVKQCEYRKIKCKFPFCYDVVPTPTLNDHVTNVHKSVLVQKYANIETHQLARCFIKDGNDIFLIMRYNSGNFFTLVAEAIDHKPVKNKLLVIKFTKPNNDSYTLSQPIMEYLEKGNHKQYDNLVWVYSRKLDGCKVHMTIENVN